MTTFDKLLVRNKNKVLSKMKELPDEKKVIALEKLRVYFPVRYEEANLANISNTVTTIGYFAVATEDNFFGCYSIPARVTMEHSEISRVKDSEGNTFYELEFEPGSAIFANTYLFKDDVISYYLFKLFTKGGKIPWYYTTDDILRLYDEVPLFSGSNVTRNIPIMDMLISITQRSPEDQNKFYRHYITRQMRANGHQAAIFPLSNVALGRSNTTAKVLGNYYDESSTSALINPSGSSEDIENLLRL